MKYIESQLAAGPSAAAAHRQHVEALLDEALAASFPSSDAISITVPDRKGCDVSCALKTDPG